MTNDITTTRAALAKDTDHLKHDAEKIVQDVKNHATAHVNAVKQKATNAIDLTRDYASEHPLHLAAAAFFLGFFIGAFRRK